MQTQVARYKTGFSTCLVETQCDDVRVQHRGVERGDEQIKVCDHDRHGAVDDALRAIHKAQGLVCEAGVISRERQWRVPDLAVS